MKTKILTTLALFLTAIIVNANCTVTTDCGTFNFPDATSISTSQTSIDGVSTLIIRDQNGTVLRTIENCGSSVSTSCESGDGDGDFDICDYIPENLKPFFGCN
ncbi:hypothetical protein ACWGOQ_0020120 [Aquimarina sp. M1]